MPNFRHIALQTGKLLLSLANYFISTGTKCTTSTENRKFKKPNRNPVLHWQAHIDASCSHMLEKKRFMNCTIQNNIFKMTFKSYQFLNFNFIWKPYLKHRKIFFLVCIKNALYLIKKSSKMFDIFFKVLILLCKS